MLKEIFALKLSCPAFSEPAVPPLQLQAGQGEFDIIEADWKRTVQPVIPGRTPEYFT